MRRLDDHEVARLLSIPLNASQDTVVASVALDGIRYICRLELDAAERERRDEYALGPVVSTGLLHALWAAGSSPAATAELDVLDLRTLSEAAPGLTELSNETARRTYRPIGEVDLIAARRLRPDRAVAHALAMPPIFRRVAMWPRDVSATPNSIRQSVERARRDGVGVIQYDADSITVVHESREAVSGVPAVYRWLVAELTYESWLQAQSAQAVS